MIHKITITFLFLLTISFAFGQFRKLEKRKHSVNKLLDEIKADNDFKNASFAFFAIDAITGEVISSYNPDIALRPASNQKLVSTATILELYGPDYRFKTILEYTGHIDTINHILHGDIIIKGGGDPALGSSYFDETKDKQFLKQWIDAIQKLGIDSIAGAIIADAGIYSKDIVPQTWSWNNMGNYYGAGANGLTIYDNMFTIFFNSGGKVGDTVIINKIEPDIPGMLFDNGVVADSIDYDNAYIYGAPYENNRYLRGEIPLNKTDFTVKGSMPDPTFFAAYELSNALSKIGIRLKGEPSTCRLLSLDGKNINFSGKEILTILSPPVSEIIAQTNIHSINLFAEHCLNHSGLKLTGRAETDSATDAVMEFWEAKGMDIQGLLLNDGSGLSQYNLITPRQFVFLMNYMKKSSKYFSIYFDSMPIAGKTGTIRNMFKGTMAEGNLRAKSGTISRVKAYSGYVKSRSGREIIFSMLVNNFSCSSGAARDKLEKLMIALAEFNK